METIEKICTKCGNRMKYWTRGNTITCPKCKAVLVVKSSTEDEEESETLKMLKEAETKIIRVDV